MFEGRMELWQAFKLAVTPPCDPPVARDVLYRYVGPLSHIGPFSPTVTSVSSDILVTSVLCSRRMRVTPSHHCGDSSSRSGVDTRCNGVFLSVFSAIRSAL